MQVGHVADNITVCEHTQCTRRTIAVNEEKYENGYDTDRSIVLFFDAVECESSEDESSAGSSPALFTRDEYSDSDDSDNEDCGPQPIRTPIIDSDCLKPSIVNNKT